MKRARALRRTAAHARPVRAFVRSVPGTLTFAALIYAGLMLPELVSELLMLIPLCVALFVLKRLPRPTSATDER